MFKKILDTIVAISTPKGLGAIGIVRLSGSKSIFIAEKIIKKTILEHSILKSNFFFNDKIIDSGLLLYFKKPKSFTGEDVIEFHAHGSKLILDKLVLKSVEFGARLAEPGEFSFRAYFNGKLDLIQAESINNLITSDLFVNNSSIIKSLIGIFSKDLKYILNNMLLLRRDIDAYIDFPDSIYFDKNHFINNFFLVKKKFFSLYDKISFYNFKSDFFKVSIIGNTNVGKSSLFNFLLNNKRSIVSNIHGTTRDFIEEKYKVHENFCLNLIDTAGFKNDFTSNLEKTTILRTFEQIKKSSLIIYMFDVTECSHAFKDNFFNLILNNFKNKDIIVVYNKIDLLKHKYDEHINDNIPNFFISIKEELGLNNLIKHINNKFSFINDEVYFVDKKFLELFINIKSHFIECEEMLNSSFNLDVLSNYFKIIYNDLSKIIGKNVEIDVIKKIFSNFCLGK
ncbi:MAG TPA: tRNA uridine-5-carboxymethylaminomethyl(34) synthesis GTPase MnmE [Candidatus Azoamicus sp.]